MSPALHQRLGIEATVGLLELFDTARQEWTADMTTIASERFERRITGEIGAGKTMLVKRLCASLDSQRFFTAHVVTTQLDGSNLLRVIAGGWAARGTSSQGSGRHGA
jgi:hypothetical protein